MAVSSSIRHPGSGPHGPQKGAGAHSAQPHPQPTARGQHPATPPHKPGVGQGQAHPQPAKKAAAPAKKGHGLLYTLLVLGVAAAAGSYFLMHGKGVVEPTPEALVQQIEDTAISAPPPANIYGGSIGSDHGSPPTVTVSGIPNKACVSAAWRLARNGIVTINGSMPERISAALLSEICNQADANTISWMSKKDL